MSEHQESLDQAVKRIEASFDKVESYSKKAGDYRITAGKLPVELQARIEAGEDGEGVEWWKWYAEHFERTRRDAQKVMALARSENPEQAAEDEREKNREAVAAHRKRVAEGTSYSKTQPDAAEESIDTPADIDPVAHTLEATDAPEEPLPEPVSIDAPKPPEGKPRNITMALPRPAPETPEDLAAELMLLVDEVTRQYDSIDPPLVRAELIRLLTKDNESIAPETPAMPIPAAAAAEGNGVDVDTSAETMKSAFAELAADLTDALSGPPKRARGRPKGPKNKPKAAA